MFFNEGVSKKQRDDIVKDLNDRFFVMASNPNTTDVRDCLKKVADATPYRYLSATSLAIAAHRKGSSTPESSFSTWDSVRAKRQLSSERSSSKKRQAVESPIKGEKSKVCLYLYIYLFIYIHIYTYIYFLSFRTHSLLQRS